MESWLLHHVHRQIERVSDSPRPATHVFTEECCGSFPLCAGLTKTSFQSHTAGDGRRAFST
ncbi:hypothetical protein IG631_21336 [Alternaria alternata]|nr:hypothetical protein IG631_21336 [Alternaria alternata]